MWTIALKEYLLIVFKRLQHFCVIFTNIDRSISSLVQLLITSLKWLISAHITHFLIHNLLLERLSKCPLVLEYMHMLNYITNKCLHVPGHHLDSVLSGTYIGGCGRHMNLPEIEFKKSEIFIICILGNVQ